MVWFWRVGLLTMIVAGVVVESPAQAPVGSPMQPWPFDEVRLNNGAIFRGLILSETSQGIDFQVVRRLPGRPTVTLTTSFSKKEVAAVRRLSDADRAILKEKITELDPTGAGERRRMDSLELTAADWPGRTGGARRYQSDQFVLISSAPDEITRRAVVRLEQIFAAFARVLPPRHDAMKPTSVYLAGTQEEYQKLIGTTTGPLLNLAIYDPVANRVICGTDLRRLGDELALTRQRHGEQLARLAKYEAEIRVLYKGQKLELDRYLDQVSRERKRIDAADQANTAQFDRATRRLFALLYHEAFHSYTTTFVYPPRTRDEVKNGKGPGELPRWANEGLAQIFETAVVEGGELRTRHADLDRLVKAQGSVRGNGPGLLPLAELLRAGPDAFLAVHAANRPETHRAYLTSWAVCFFLIFDRQAIGTQEFDRYLAQVNSGEDPIKAFEQWVGQDLPQFEKELHQYLLELREDGTRVPAPKKP